MLLDGTIVNTAIPSILSDLHAPFDLAVWVINAYLLVLAALLILAGRLGDIFGPRRMFVVGLAIFGISSALCGAAQTGGELVAARVLQGIGAAALAPQSLVLIRAIFPRDRMGAAFGVLSSTVGLAAVAGPTLGGLLITSLGWRWVFYVNPPIALIGIVGAYAVIPDVRTGRRHRLDPVGVLLAALGLTAVMYAVIEGQRHAWGRVAAGITIPEILIASLLLLAAFTIWERFQPEPLVPLGLFRMRTFAIMAGLSVAVQFALQAQLLVNSVNMQTVLGMTPIRYGLTSLPLTVALVALAPFAGRLTDRFGGKYTLITGLTVYALGALGVALVSSTHATSATFVPPLLVEGIGLGAIFAPISTEAMRAAPQTLAGSASGVINTARQLGAALGSSITGAMLSSRLATSMHGRAIAAAGQLPPAVRPAFVAGFSQSATEQLQVGRGQSGVSVPLPANVPQGVASRIRALAHDVFANGYISALRPTLAVPVVILLTGAVFCLLFLRRPAPAPANN